MIVHVLGRMTVGGNERLCLELIRRAPASVDQALVTIDATPEGPLENLFHEIPGLRFFHVPYSRNERTRFVLQLARRFTALHARGVIVYPFGLHLLVALAAKARRGCRTIVHVGNPPPATPAGRACFRNIVVASRLLSVPCWCCSHTVYDQLSALARLPSDSRGIPNGINIPALRAAAKKGAALRTERGPVMTMTARLDSIKDHDTLLAAFQQVVRQRPTAKLWLVGDGSRREELERQVKALGIDHAVTFWGGLRQVGELLGQTDVFAFSTTAAEGFGIAVAEAMAVSLPIVATDVPACREVLDQGRCGRLVPPQNPEALASAVLAMMDDRAQALALGRAAADYAEQNYDIAGVAAQYYGYLLDNRD